MLSTVTLSHLILPGPIDGSPVGPSGRPDPSIERSGSDAISDRRQRRRSPANSRCRLIAACDRVGTTPRRHWILAASGYSSPYVGSYRSRTCACHGLPTPEPTVVKPEPPGK